MADVLTLRRASFQCGKECFGNLLVRGLRKKQRDIDVDAVFESLAYGGEAFGRARDLEDGININITLLFAQSAYEQVAEAFLSALEARAAKGQDISHIASVASFFVSRIDTLVDSKIDEKLKTTTDASQKALLESIRGKIAIANARLTYNKNQELSGGPRWRALAAKGAQTQRLLWASTSTKNPKYRDVIYVEELIGPDTVYTIPPATFEAFRDRAKLRPTLTENVEAAANTVADL